MNDQELDILFAQSAQERKAVEVINRQVMKTVRRDMRLKVIRKWAKLLGLCFGLPLMVVLYVYLLLTFTPGMEPSIRFAAFILPLGTMAVVFGKNLRDFSIFEL